MIYTSTILVYVYMNMYEHYIFWKQIYTSYIVGFLYHSSVVTVW